VRLCHPRRRRASYRAAGPSTRGLLSIADQNKKRALSLRPSEPLLWNGTPERLAHQPAMHAELLGYCSIDELNALIFWRP
jgi:hypothetical protein